MTTSSTVSAIPTMPRIRQRFPALAEHYEQRLATRRQAVPVILVVGVAVAAFGTSLLVTDVRRRRTTVTPG